MKRLFGKTLMRESYGRPYTKKRPLWKRHCGRCERTYGRWEGPCGRGLPMGAYATEPMGEVCCKMFSWGRTDAK
eukprot:3564427-Pyramimonas_sp.AAC.1